MSKMTITEGLAEIKTINARIAKKRESVMRYFARDGRLRDPLEADGGSIEFVKKERQAIRDLEERIVDIRCAIQAVNLKTKVAVGEQSRTVASWLNWRREVSEHAKQFLATMTATVSKVRQECLKQGWTVTDKETSTPGEVIVAVNEKQLAKETEAMEQTLGELDGKLSLLNATTTIDV
jgi:hypothetical protein